jgi:hypothetical protein
MQSLAAHPLRRHKCCARTSLAHDWRPPPLTEKKGYRNEVHETLTLRSIVTTNGLTVPRQLVDRVLQALWKHGSQTSVRYCVQTHVCTTAIATFEALQPLDHLAEVRAAATMVVTLGFLGGIEAA